jgi:hypothetical protein
MMECEGASRRYQGGNEWEVGEYMGGRRWECVTLYGGWDGEGV